LISRWSFSSGDLVEKETIVRPSGGHVTLTCDLSKLNPEQQQPTEKDRWT